MTVSTISRRTYRVGALGVCFVAIAAGTASWRLWPQTPSAPASTVPSWFRPIAHYYGNNPRITPQFDFASLYAGTQPKSSH